MNALILLLIACAPAPPRGQFVAIADEEALIIYDAATKTETFVRRATFDSTSPRFGFLVPTPTKPELDEAPNEIFDVLEEAITPEVRYETKGIEFEPWSILFIPFMTLSRSGPGAEKSVVRVLEVKRVAGYEATVLEADDPKALADWLSGYGFESRPELVAWLAPYVEAKWKLTAFNVGRDEKTLDARFGTSAVRMTFQIDRPFFPYREPEDQRTNTKPLPRNLRVHLISGSKMSGTLEHTPDGTKQWPGKLEYAAPLPAIAQQVFTRLKLAPPANAWLNTFLDPSSPRPGTTELYFDPAKDQEKMLPEPIIHAVPSQIPLPLDIPIIIGIVLWVRHRRKGKVRS